MHHEAELASRLRRLEQKVDFLLNELGLAAKEAEYASRPEPWLSEVMALLERGNKIEAIKKYRELTGVDLREAKEAVERLSW